MKAPVFVGSESVGCRVGSFQRGEGRFSCKITAIDCGQKHGEGGGWRAGLLMFFVH